MRPSSITLLCSLIASNKSGRLLYQHGYHAGNYADVMKHSVLIMLLQHMRLKSSPFVYVETHSGAGKYQLNSFESSERPPEHKRGISLLLGKDRNKVPSPTRVLLDLVDELSKVNGDNIIYPGSPWIASRLCRNDDSLVFCENASDQFELLKNNLGSDPRMRLLLDNGYKALKQRENIDSQKRALIFIDPPYQLGSDTEQTAALVGFLQRHWRSARVAIWNPISSDNRERTMRLYGAIQKAVPGSECLAAELDNGGASNDVGSGMIMVNPPYGLDKKLAEVLSQLGQALQNDNAGPEVRVEWLSKQKRS